MRLRSDRSSSLESLPSELFLSIAEYADFEARLSLSATNSSCRALLLQTIFRTLKVTSNEDEANEVLALAKRVGGNVRAISFHGTAGPNLNADNEDEHDDDKNDDDESSQEVPANSKPSAADERPESQKWVLPPAAAALLSGAHLPNVTTLIVHFNFNFDEEGTWDSRDELSDGASMYAFTVEETSKAMIDESEEEFAWRRLMAQTWTAVSENENITELVVKDLIPKAVSPWFSPQWERFLSQILVADVQLWGGDNGAGWEVGTLEGYMYFVANLDTYFFDFMKNTKKLRLSCYEHGPLGSLWTSQLGQTSIDVQGTMSLRPNCLPQLEHLHLEYALICTGLVAFLTAKSHTLKHVTLHECFASSEYSVTWADLFTALRKTSPTWQSFNITNDAAPPLTFKEWQESKHGKEEAEAAAGGRREDEEETEDVKRVRAELAESPKKRLFLYATLMDKYGDRWPDYEDIMEHFHAGKDLEEWEKLNSLLVKESQA